MVSDDPFFPFYHRTLIGTEFIHPIKDHFIHPSNSIWLWNEHPSMFFVYFNSNEVCRKY